MGRQYFLKKGVNTVMSLERSQYVPFSNKNVVIDEAAMVSPAQALHLLCRPFDNIVVAGDPLQIGPLDLYEAGGILHTQSLLDIVPS